MISRLVCWHCSAFKGDVTNWLHAEPDSAKAYTKMLEKFKDYHPDIVNVLRYAT